MTESIEGFYKEESSLSQVEVIRTYFDILGDCEMQLLASMMLHNIVCAFKDRKEGFWTYDDQVWIVREHSHWWDHVRCSRNQALRTLKVLVDHNLVIVDHFNTLHTRTTNIRVNWSVLIQAWGQFRNDRPSNPYLAPRKTAVKQKETAPKTKRGTKLVPNLDLVSFQSSINELIATNTSSNPNSIIGSELNSVAHYVLGNHSQIAKNEVKTPENRDSLPITNAHACAVLDSTLDSIYTNTNIDSILNTKTHSSNKTPSILSNTLLAESTYTDSFGIESDSSIVGTSSIVDSNNYVRTSHNYSSVENQASERSIPEKPKRGRPVGGRSKESTTTQTTAKERKLANSLPYRSESETEAQSLVYYFGDIVKEVADVDTPFTSMGREIKSTEALLKLNLKASFDEVLSAFRLWIEGLHKWAEDKNIILSYHVAKFTEKAEQYVKQVRRLNQPTETPFERNVREIEELTRQARAGIA